jgi:hypothetical protein
MSTRSQIKVEGSPVIIYRHSDGYPRSVHGVLFVLIPFVQDFFRRRGYDAEYCVARCLGAFLLQEEAERQKDLTDPERAAFRHYAEETRVTGYGLDLELHGDTAYLYTVTKEGEIVVGHRDYGSRPNFDGPIKFKEEDRIPLTRVPHDKAHCVGCQTPEENHRPDSVAPLTDPQFVKKLAKYTKDDR